MTPRAAPSKALAAAAAALALAGLLALAPGIMTEAYPVPAYAQGAHPECQTGASAGTECVYHVTRAFAVGDIRSNEIRADGETGHVYVANRPFISGNDANHSYLRVYDSHANGHGLIKEIRFNGTDSRIDDFEINAEKREIHVVHRWIAPPDNTDNSSRSGRVNMTTIDMGAYGVAKTIELYHGEIAPGGTDVVNKTRFVMWDMALDEGRDMAYVSADPSASAANWAPIMAVNTSDTTLLYAVVNNTAGTGGGGWDAYDVGAPASALAVDNDTGLVYAAVRIGDRGIDGNTGSYAWGIATLSFLDGGGAAAPNYTRVAFYQTASQTTTERPPNDGTYCDRGGANNYNFYPCDRHVIVESLILDKDRGQLFALYGNHSVWAFRINGTGHPDFPVPVDPVNDDRDETVWWTYDLIHDMELDAGRGLLHVVRHDFTDPRLVVINATDRAGNYTEIGTASLTSQPVGIGLNRAEGTVYALPEWSPHAYVIEAEPKSDLQGRIDNASGGATVTVPAGTYDDTVLDITKPLTLTSETGMPGDVVFTGYSRIEVEADNVTIRGMAFEDTDCLPGYGAPLVEIRTRNNEDRGNILVENSEFRHTCHAAIQKEGIADIANITIRNNVFENIGLRLPAGVSEPLDTGGENEFQIAHGAIGLAHHPGQGTVGGTISGNHISGTSAAGIRVFKADGLAITGNYIANTPASAIGLAHLPKNVLVANNTIVGANSEPNLDYLAGVDGSGERGHYRFVSGHSNRLQTDLYYDGSAPASAGPPNRPGHRDTLAGAGIPWNGTAWDGAAVPSPDAAISVWSNAENVTITGNTIVGSDGAFTVCTGVCAFESDGFVRVAGRNIAAITGTEGIGDEINFTGNTVHAHSGPDNGGVLVRSLANGTINATGNTFVGCGMGGDPVPTAGGVDNGSASYSEGGCVYHVTRTLAVGDIIPDIVRVDNGTGIVYVANRPHLGAADQGYSHLRIYDNRANGHELIGDIRFNGTNSRISDVEIGRDAVYVAHMWGLGDRGLGWDGRPWNGDGRANLTRIDLGTHAVNGTIELFHGEVLPGGGAATNITRNVVGDLALDVARGRAYVSMERYGPILAVDTSGAGMRLAYASFNGTAAAGSGGGEWNAYAVGAPASALAVDGGTGLVYAAVRTGDRHDPSTHSWGIATLSFDGDGGALAPNYTRSHLLPLSSAPAAGCEGDYAYDCGGDILAESLILDGERGRLFALYGNHTVWAYSLDGEGRPGSPAEVDVRLDDPPPAVYGEIGHPQTVQDQIGGIALDAGRGLLYASLYDFANPRVVVIDADAPHGRVGAASVSSQTVGLAVDGGTGAVYALPQWTPNAYVIEAAQRPVLQHLVDNARPGSAITLLPNRYDDTVLDVTKPLALQSAGGAPGPVVFAGQSRIEVEADDVAIRGLSFEDTACMPGFAGSLVEIRTYHDRTRSGVAIEGNSFSNTCHAAIQQEGTGAIAGISIRGNAFEDIGLRLPAGASEPIDTGGENEFQLFHGAIGLAFHPFQKTVGGAISGNTIDGTSAAGIRVFNADGMTISGNTIRDTPASAIGLSHGPSNVVVANNTIAGANSEPDLDYLAGVNGSGEPGYYRFINLDLPNPYAYLGMEVLTDVNAAPSPDAAISVWADAENLTVAGNTIRGSDGAFTVCTGVCAFESDGPVRNNTRNVPDDTGAITGQVRFNDNTVHAHTGPDNNGRLVTSYALGTLDATGNTFVGTTAAAAASGMVRADADRAPRAASVDAAFASPSTIRIVYDAPLGPPAGHEGPVYGNVTGPGGLDEAPASVSGLYTELHTASLGSDADSMRSATIALGVDLEGVDMDGVPYEFTADAIPVKPRLQVARVTTQNATNATYYAGDTISIAVEFNRAAIVDAGAGSAPTLGLEIGGADRRAGYAGGSGTDTLVFTYAVLLGDRASPLEHAGAGALEANGATIRDTAGIDAVLGLPTDPPSTLGAALLEIGIDPNVGIEAASFSSPSTARIVYGAPLHASASDYTDLRVGAPGAAAAVTGVAGSGTRVHTVSFDPAGRAVDAATGGSIDIAPLASPSPPRGSWFAGADGQAVNSSADAGAVAAAPRGSPPVVITPDSFVNTVRGNQSAAISVPSGMLPAAINLTVATEWATVTFAPGTNMTSRGTGTTYAGVINVTVAAGAPGADRRDAAVDGLEGLGVANASGRLGHVVEIGDPGEDIDLNEPARIVLFGQPSPAKVYHMNSTGGLTQVGACGAASDPAGWLADNRNASQFCHAVPAGAGGGTADYTIYTYRLSAFFVVKDAPPAPPPAKPDPTPPTPAQPDPGPAVVVVTPTPAPGFGGFGGGGGSGGGGGGGGGARLATGGGAVTLYGASWDCDDGKIRVTINADAYPEVTVLSSEGTVAAQRGEGPHPAGRTVYEAPLPDDPILSIRAVQADGRAVSTASETVRTGGQCDGEATFRQYDAPAGAQPPQPQPQPQQPTAEQEGRPGEPAGREEEETPQEPQPQPQEQAGMPAEPPADLPDEPAAEQQPEQPPQVPPPPAEPPAADRPGEQEAGQDGGQQAAVQPPPPTAAEDGAAEDEGGCLVATAAHGTELAPQVQFLREVRDGTLLTTESGRAFMSVFGAAYYSFSPQVADLERGHPALRQAAAVLLAPMLHALSVVGAAEPGSEHSVVAHGALAIAMVAGMYVAAPAAGAWYAVRLGRGRRRRAP